MRHTFKLWHGLVLALLIAAPLAWGANTMWSALSTITGANTASGDRFPLLDISDTTHGAGGTAKTITRDELRFALGGSRTFLLGSNYTNATTTGTEVTGLGPITLTAGTYYMHMPLIVRTDTTTTGWKLGINYTGTVTQMAVNMKYPSTGTTAATGVGEDAVANNTGSVMEAAAATTESTTSPNLGPTAGVASTGANILVIVEGLVVVSDGGDLELWAGAEVATTMTIFAGSAAIITPLQ